MRNEATAVKPGAALVQSFVASRFQALGMNSLMELRDILPAVDAIANTRIDDEFRRSRAATYLRTYPDIITLGTAADQPDPDLSRLHRIALMAYGWMPRVLCLDPEYIPSAVLALEKAQVATADNWDTVPVCDLVRCLRSTVAASKVLHFTNPQVFPIWDRKVERFRRRAEIYQYQMNQLNYEGYVREIHAIKQDPEFEAFFNEFSEVFGLRLEHLGIVPYELTAVRAIEAAAFELADDEPNNG